MCVADGCGGLGSRRYPLLKDRTGAYAASRLIARIMKRWAGKVQSLPQDAASGREMLRSLENFVAQQFSAFAKKNQMDLGRIVGSMQRILPTTICALFPAAEGGFFLWCGDSRGCLLTRSGLSQYTEDDVKSQLDTLERLYRDSSLSLCISADRPIQLHLRRFHETAPHVQLCMTDGVYSCLPSPMELEMMLLSTMQAADDMASWQRKLGAAVRKLCQDDATVAARPVGFLDYAEMKRFFQPRWQFLEKQYIRPVRESGMQLEKNREYWQKYRGCYEKWEASEYGEADWRI